MNSEMIKMLEYSYALIYQANLNMIDAWLKYQLFTWRWWLQLFLTVVPWILWLIIRKKESSDRLLYAGFFTLIISSWLDFMGVLFHIWGYRFDIVPFAPAYITFDFTLVPVSIMLFLQYKPKTKPIYKGIVFSFLTSFIIQPIFVIIGFYDPRNWKHYYSFPIFLLIYLIADWISKRNKFEKI